MISGLWKCKATCLGQLNNVWDESIAMRMDHPRHFETESMLNGLPVLGSSTGISNVGGRTQTDNDEDCKKDDNDGCDHLM